jgi:hypothetical protein
MVTVGQEATLMEIAEQSVEGQCGMCDFMYPTVRACWLLDVAKGDTAFFELLTDRVRDQLPTCPNVNIVELVRKFRTNG